MSFICSSCRWTEFYDDDQGKTYHLGIRRTIQMLYSIVVTQLFGVGIKGFDGTLGAFSRRHRSATSITSSQSII